ncbi:hypothetical protein Tco_0091220 [Tanacetum coccineum]
MFPPESLGGVAVLSGEGMVPEETEWDYAEPFVGLGGVTLVSVGGFLDLGLLLFLKSAPRTSGPYDLAIIWADNSMSVTLDGSFVKLELLRMPVHLFSGGVVPAENLNHKSEQNSPSHGKGVFQDWGFVQVTQIDVNFA